ncbi:MAG: UDP-glucose 4-epimerase [Chloroflexota bacterium]|nr:UDP-glucose 4-epimerase [Chloroflexota bacterium]
MIVGLPGAGISGIFYLVCVFLMPFNAVWQQARGRELPAGHWRRIARHWLVGAGIVAVLYAVGWALSLANPAPAPLTAGGGGGGPTAEAESPTAVVPVSPVESLARVGAVLTVGTLAGVAILVQVLSVYQRHRGSPAGASATPAGAVPLVDTLPLDEPVETGQDALGQPGPRPSPFDPAELRPPFRRALVTGGAGFIGSHIAEALLASGCETVVLDDLSTGSRSQVPARAEFIHADIVDPATVSLIAAAQPDLVIHAAARVSVADSMANPEGDRAVNVVGTQHVVEGARAAGAKRFVFISSGGAIYGDSPAARELTLPAPASYYGIHKLAAEGYVAVSGLSYGIARFANVYGPRQRAGLEGGVVAIFIETVLARRPVTIFGSGEQVRDFVHVGDAVSGVLAVARTHLTGTWNVGTGVASSINALLSQVTSAMGHGTSVNHAPARVGDVASSRLLIERIRSDLGWAPRVSLAAGIRDLAARATAGAPSADPDPGSRPRTAPRWARHRDAPRDPESADDRLSGGTLRGSH